MAGHLTAPDVHTSAARPAPVEAKFCHLAAPETVIDGIRTSMRIPQMDCPTEAEMIRKKLSGMTPVRGLEFNPVQRVLTVVHTPGTLEPILEAIRLLGFKPELPGGLVAGLAIFAVAACGMANLMAVGNGLRLLRQ